MPPKMPFQEDSGQAAATMGDAVLEDGVCQMRRTWLCTGARGGSRNRGGGEATRRNASGRWEEA